MMSSLNPNSNKSQPNMVKRGSIGVKRRKKKRNSCTSTTPDNGISRHYVPSVDKQVLFQDIIKQFAEWPTWQKRLLLCRFTERTSSNLLSTLSTVLEPIFHRDFEIKSKHGFHSTLIKTFLDSSINSTPLTNTSLSVKHLSPLPESTSHHSSSHTPNVNISPDIENIENLTSQQNTNKEVDHPLSTSSSGNSYHKSRSPQSVEKLSYSHSPTSSHQTVASASTICSVGKKSSRNIRDFKRRMTLRPSDNNFCVSNIDSTLDDMRRQRGISHTHLINRNSGSLSTMEFIQYSQHKNVKRLGELVKPSVNKNSLSCVGQYKHQKWWLPPIRNEQNLQRASKRNLLRSFKKITDEFVQKYTLWSNAEKGDFMLHIVDYCLPDEIIFLANCIYHRLEKFNDINNLSDNVLLNVFSFLEIDDLNRAGQVSQRWKYLTSSGYIWEKRCYNLACKHGQLDVIKNLEMSCVELDWKQLYNELKESISILESCESHINVPVPSVLSNQKISENSSNNVIYDNESHDSEDVYESDKYDKSLSERFSDRQMPDMHTDDGLGCVECNDVVVHNHVSFVLGQNYEMLASMESKDGIEDEYATEEEVNAGNKVEEALQEEKKYEEKDVAFDVRVRLVQPANQIKNEVVTISKPDTEVDYQLMQVSNIKTVNRVRKLEGHGDAVLCLQFDSKRVMTGSSDRTVRLWDIRSGRYFHSLVGHQGGVRCLKFDERYIATGSWDTTVMVWDVVNFVLICTITEHTDCVSCIELTSDTLITASYDTTICIFMKDSWQLLSRLEEHTAPVSCMTLLSPIQLLTGSHDRTLLLWDLDTYCILRKFDGLKSSCLCVKICGSLVAAGASDGTITFWNLLNSDIEGRIAAHNGCVNTLCFVQSRFYSAGGDNVVREWDLSTCTCLRSLRGHTGPVLCLRASSKRIVSGSADGTSRIWDMTCKLQQVGRNYDELNKSIIQTQVLNEHQFKEMTVTN